MPHLKGIDNQTSTYIIEGYQFVGALRSDKPLEPQTIQSDKGRSEDWTLQPFPSTAGLMSHCTSTEKWSPLQCQHSQLAACSLDPKTGCDTPSKADGRWSALGAVQCFQGRSDSLGDVHDLGGLVDKMIARVQPSPLGLSAQALGGADALLSASSPASATTSVPDLSRPAFSSHDVVTLYNRFQPAPNSAITLDESKVNGLSFLTHLGQGVGGCLCAASSGGAAAAAP